MKILHIISDTVLGGAQKVCIDLANSADNDGNEVAVAAMPEGPLWTQLNSSIKQFYLKNMNKKIGLNLIRVIRELKVIRREYNPDIIHLHTSIPGILGRWVFRKEKKHIVYTVHGFDQIRVAHKKFLFLEKYFQKYAGAIVAISKYDFENMSKLKIKNNLKLISNGIDSKVINSINNFPVLIKENKIVLAIARIAPPKDMELFTEVAKKFEKSDTAFVWIGDSVNETLENLREKYNMPDNLYLTGAIKNACDYINLCNVFVLFSHHEGLPISILEAMSQSKPIIASNVGGIPELVSDENGALVNTVDEACTELEKLIDNTELLLLKGQKSYEKFKNNFTLDKMWEQYKDLYLDLLKK